MTLPLLHFFSALSYLNSRFSSNPAGIGRDADVFNDAESRLPMEEPFNLSWNTFWDVRVEVNGQGRKNNLLSFDPTRLRLACERRTKKGLGAYFGFSRAGKDYVPGIGFEMREDFTASRVEILYGWIPGEKSFLQSHSIQAEASLALRNEDSTLESAHFMPRWEFNTKSGWGGYFAYRFNKESLRELLEFSTEANVPPGEYTFSGLRSLLHAPKGGF